MPADNGANPPKKGIGCLGGCLAVIGVIVLIGIIVGVSSALAPKKEYDANNKFEVIAQCEDQVKARLKAPSTAKFDNEEATGSGTWTVTGTVDSENSFGAMLRADFQCTVIVEGETIKTRVDSLG